MDFPFLGRRTSPGLVRYRNPKWPADKPAQEIDVHWSGLKLQHWNGRHFHGQRPYFGCPFCKRRTIKLYDGGFGLSCRACVNLRFKSQQVRRPSVYAGAKTPRKIISRWQRAGRGLAKQAIPDVAQGLSAAFAPINKSRGCNFFHGADCIIELSPLAQSQQRWHVCYWIRSTSLLSSLSGLLGELVQALYGLALALYRRAERVLLVLI